MRAQATPDRVGALPFTGVLCTPFAALGIRVEDGVLRSIDFLALDQPELAPRDAVSETVMGQIQRYLDDPRWIFTSPAAPAGTAFQNRVWAALRRIASGDARSYGGIARELSTSPRAVGGACRANPIPLIIPCHRVVSASGVGGFDGMAQGRGPSIKSWLLEHEGYRKDGARRVA